MILSPTLGPYFVSQLEQYYLSCSVGLVRALRWNSSVHEYVPNTHHLKAMRQTFLMSGFLLTASCWTPLEMGPMLELISLSTISSFLHPCLSTGRTWGSGNAQTGQSQC